MRYVLDLVDLEEGGRGGREGEVCGIRWVVTGGELVANLINGCICHLSSVEVSSPTRHSSKTRPQGRVLCHINIIM